VSTVKLRCPGAYVSFGTKLFTTKHAELDEGAGRPEHDTSIP
jgi:hypothetical protein